MKAWLPPTPVPSARIARRRLLAAGALAGLGVAPDALGGDVGPIVPPQPVPSLVLHRDDGTRPMLATQLRGTQTLVQLMFTGCSSVCPIQGALFAALQAQLIASRDSATRLLSLSIDPLADDPPALRDWLRRFGARPGWHAAAPQPQALDAMLSFFKGGVAGGDRHTGQVYVFDRDSRLVWRTSELPPLSEVMAALQRSGRQASRAAS